MRKLLIGFAVTAILAQPALAAEEKLNRPVDDVVVSFHQEPNEALQNARMAFLDNRTFVAQNAIEHAAKFIALEAKYAVDVEGKDSLSQSYAELQNLAKGVADEEARAVSRITVEEFDKVFAHALYNLASFQYHCVEKYWKEGNARATGQTLHAAVNNLRYAASWAGHTLTKGELQEINGMRQTAKRMIRGSTYHENKAMDVLGKLKHYLHRLYDTMAAPKVN